MSFESDLRKFAAKTGLGMDKTVRGVTIAMGNSLIEKSPVDTGRFRGNWQHSTGAPTVGPLQTTDSTGSQTKAKLNASIATVEAGNIEYVVNNLPYAIPLEYGHSKIQAPAGMVRVTVAKFRENLAKEVKRL